MDPKDKTGFQQFLQDSTFSDPMKSAIGGTVEAIGVVSSLVGSITSIVGIIGALGKLASLLGAANAGPDPLTLLAQQVQRIETTLNSLFIWNESAQWNDTLAKLDQSLAALRRFLDGTQDPGGTRPGLLSDTARNRLTDTVLDGLTYVRYKLLPGVENGVSPYQQSRFQPRAQDDSLQVVWSVDYSPENLYSRRLDPAVVGVTGLPEVAPTEWRSAVPDGGLRWDYRRALPHLLRTLTALTSSYKLIDPAFRTTQRFEADILELVNDLDIFAARWMSCISWSVPLGLFPHSDDDNLGWFQQPLAYESRSRVAYGHGNEFTKEALRDQPWVPLPDEPLFSQKNLEYARKVVTYSGFQGFRAHIDQLRQLTTLPLVSETINPIPTVSGFRSFQRLAKAHRNGDAQTVKIYHVDWIVTAHLSFQPQLAPYDYAAGSPIAYAFFLESYASAGRADLGMPLGGLLERQAVHPGVNQRLTIKVQNPEVFVPTEDDGTFGGHQGNGLHALAPIITSKHDKEVNRVLGDIATAVATTAPDRERNKDPGNKLIGQISGAWAAIANIFFASGAPAGTQYLHGSPTPLTFGFSLTFGPNGDIRYGTGDLSAWNIDGQNANAGGLYFVVEETPPLSLSHRIRTLIPIALNPTETWYPAYSRTGHPLLNA